MCLYTKKILQICAHTSFFTLQLPAFDFPRQIYGWSVGQTGNDKNHITGNADADQGSDAVHAPKGAEAVQKRIEGLGDHG